MHTEDVWRGGDEAMWPGRGERPGHGRGRGRGPRTGRPGFRGGPGSGGGPGFGGPGFGPWPGDMRMGRGPRAKRGDVRAAALALLAEHPMNGYQVIQEIGERSDGVWRPSPGSVYPALQQLEDEGLIEAGTDDNGRRTYQLTEEGRGYVAGHPDEVRAPWDEVAGSVSDSAIEMRNLLRQVGMAGYQVLSAGTPAQLSQARQILTNCRKSLYRVLAADDEDESTASGEGA